MCVCVSACLSLSTVLTQLALPSLGFIQLRRQHINLVACLLHRQLEVTLGLLQLPFRLVAQELPPLNLQVELCGDEGDNVLQCG